MLDNEITFLALQKIHIRDALFKTLPSTDTRLDPTFNKELLKKIHYNKLKLRKV